MKTTSLTQIVATGLRLLVPVASATVLAACLGSSDPSASAAAGSNTNPNEAGNGQSGNGNQAELVTFVPNAKNQEALEKGRKFENKICADTDEPTKEGGKVYAVNLQSKSGHNISFSVFEPATINCEIGNPLVLEGHGYGGSKQAAPNGLTKRLVDAGAGIITIDQRGFGQSGGTVRVMDPDFEGQDLLQILDWAENNLDWLRYANNKPANGKKLNMVLGSTGGSYGGGYQLLIHNVDPDHRLDAMTPDITWNDLRYSLNPGGAYGIKDFKPAEGEVAPRGTVKSGWALLLVAGGESGSISPKFQAGDFGAVQSSGQDNLIRETLIRGSLSNRFPDGALEFFRYHSPSYWCDSEVAGKQVFLQSEVKPGLPQKKPVPVDILFTQGFRDTLFNFNDAFHNFKCYRDLTDEKGRKADVRLLTHQNGHILPVSPYANANLQQFSDQAAANGLNEIQFQKPAGPRACGGLNITDAQFAFLVEKLFTKEEAAAIAAKEEHTAFADLSANKGKVCMSLADDENKTEASEDASVWITEADFLGKGGPTVKGAKTASSLPAVPFELVPGSDPTSVVFSGPAGTVRYPFAPAVFKLNVPATGFTIAGVPSATVDVAPLAAQNPQCAALQDGAAQSPVGVLGAELGCDPMVFVGLGVKRGGVWRLIDDQVTPIRGYGKRHVEMNGVAEKISAGEEVALMVYGYHPQFPATNSRDIASPIVSLKGELNLPVFP